MGVVALLLYAGNSCDEQIKRKTFRAKPPDSSDKSMTTVSNQFGVLPTGRMADRC